MLYHMVKDVLRFAFLYLEFYLPFGKKRVHLEIWKFNDMSVGIHFWFHMFITFQVEIPHPMFNENYSTVYFKMVLI